jgi:hypothetical protein
VSPRKHRDALLTLIVRPDTVVREHTVEVEDGEPTARGRSRPLGAASGKLLGVLEVLERDLLVRGQRMLQAASEQLIELVGRQTAVRR